MAESSSHIRLVNHLVAWISDNYLNGDLGGLLMDLSSSPAPSRPPSIHGFVPDAYVKLAGGEEIIIGEAKTPRDLERAHTRDQLRAFLRECASSTNGLLVIAVPWHVSRLAKSMLKILQKENDWEKVSSIVLDRLG